MVVFYFASGVHKKNDKRPINLLIKSKNNVNKKGFGVGEETKLMLLIEEAYENA